MIAAEHLVVNGSTGDALAQAFGRDEVVNAPTRVLLARLEAVRIVYRYYRSQTSAAFATMVCF